MFLFVLSKILVSRMLTMAKKSCKANRAGKTKVDLEIEVWKGAVP